MHRHLSSGLLLLSALTAAAAAPLSGQTPRRTVPVRALEGPTVVSLRAPSLQASIGYTRIEFDVNRPLAQATGGLVPFTVKYNGKGNVASVQVPGSISYPLGAHAGSFEQTVSNADIRAIMKRDEAAILSRCTSTLDYNQVDSINTVHDSKLPVTVNGPDGTVVASTTILYQLGLTCKRVPPLSVAIGYTRIEYSIAQPLANAKGGLVPLTVKFTGTGNVSSVQVPGSLSYPLGAHSGSFEQTISNADIRAIMKRDEAAILDRCKSTLDYNNVPSIDTVHDAKLPVTVNGPDGAVVASITVPYQLGLTCTR
jgi:DNA-binding protein YbaB